MVIDNIYRENLEKNVLSTDNKNIVLELPTSFGKSKIALDIINKRYIQNQSILIVIPRNVLIDGWHKEINKWHPNLDKNVQFITYKSFAVMYNKKDYSTRYDYVVFDEAHHLSNRCIESLNHYSFNNCILLSATLDIEKRSMFTILFDKPYFVRVSIKDATDNDVLPIPTIVLFKMHLNDSVNNCTIVKNPKRKNPIDTTYKHMWAYKDVKNRRVNIKCTQAQYYSNMSNMIDWYSRKGMTQLKLRLSLDRLIWLSNQKTGTIKDILYCFKNYRTLTFCNSIKHTETLGKYCINSKNKKSDEYLDMFNNSKIDHITACNKLDEGANLTNCRVGIYAYLNASNRVIVQKLGRLLRHKNPIIIIPYYANTREEYIVANMVKNYNVIEINSIKELKELQNEKIKKE